MTTTDRFLPTPSILNLRDYGGYAVAGGGHVRRGRLFRSADLSNANDQDLAIVDELNLSAIIDLRSSEERSTRPSRRSPGSQAKTFHVAAPSEAAAPHIAAMTGPRDAASVRERLIRYYTEAPFRDAQRQGFRLLFETVIESDGPTLVHCAAGKDRTGMAVALLLAALGVDPVDIVADYMLTNTCGSLDARAEAFAYSVSHHFGHSPSEDVLRAALMVDHDYIDAMFRAISSHCGSVDRYIEQKLLISPSKRQSLAEGLLD